MSADYPLVLRLAGRSCVVVGGGAVAGRKAAALIRVDADITIVAPDIAPEIERLAEAGAVSIQRRRFEASDLDGALLAFAATDNREVNRAVAEAARARRVLVNVADDPSACDFTVPALVRRQDVTLSISTGGRSPAFSRYLREELEAWLTDERCLLLELLAEVRRDLRAAGTAVRSGAWHDAIADEAIAEALAAGDREGARRRLLESLTAGQ